MARIHKIAKQYENSDIMQRVSQVIEKYIDKLLEGTKEDEKKLVEKEEEAEG